MAPLSTYVATAKDLLSFLRDLLIFLLVVLLLCFPAALKQRLVAAGIREGEFMGMKFTAEEIDKTNISLNESQMAITNLKKQLDSTSQLLAQAQTKITDPEFKAEVSKMETKNADVVATASMIQTSVKQTIASNAPKVLAAQEIVNKSNSWGIVYGADANLKAAQFEAGPIATKLQLPNVTVYLRQGSYRSVAVVNDRSQADDILASAKRRRPDAYIVSMSSWCPQSEKRDGYVECTQ